MKDVLAYLSGVNWTAWTFPFLVFLGVLYLFRLDRDSTPFKLVNFISDQPDGTGNSRSLAYIVALLVSTWLIWFEAIQGRMSDLLFTAYIGAFVLGGVASHLTGSRERVGIAKANRPQSEMSPVKISTTTQADTSVTPE